MAVIGQSHLIWKSRVADYTFHGNTIVRIVPIEVGQNSGSSNSRSFWQEIRRLKENKSKQNNVSLQTFYDHFSQVYSENSAFSINHVETFVENNLSGNSEATESVDIENTDSLDLPISRDEVIKAISKLKRNKSAGSDLLPPELFIDAADCVTQCEII